MAPPQVAGIHSAHQPGQQWFLHLLGALESGGGDRTTDGVVSYGMFCCLQLPEVVCAGLGIVAGLMPARVSGHPPWDTCGRSSASRPGQHGAASLICLCPILRYLWHPAGA